MEYISQFKELLVSVVALCLVLGTLIPLFVKLIKSIVLLTTATSKVSDGLTDLNDKNSKAHERIWTKLDEHEGRLTCQELICKERHDGKDK